jgi:hypothetical protein
MNKKIITLLGDRSVKIWGKEDVTYNFNIDDLWVYDDKYLLSQEDNYLTLWDPITGISAYEYELEPRDSVISILTKGYILIQREFANFHRLFLLDIKLGEFFSLEGDIMFSTTSYVELNEVTFAVNSGDTIHVYGLNEEVFHVKLPYGGRLAKYTEDKLFIFDASNTVYTLDVNTQELVKHNVFDKPIHMIKVIGNYIVAVIAGEALVYISYGFFFDSTAPFRRIKDIKVMDVVLELPDGKIAFFGEYYEEEEVDEEYLGYDEEGPLGSRRYLIYSNFRLIILE